MLPSDAAGLTTHNATSALGRKPTSDGLLKGGDMTATMLDPRLALADRRAIIKGVLAQQRAALAELGCGCGRGTCMDEGAREQLETLIRKNVQSISDLSDLICDYQAWA